MRKTSLAVIAIVLLASPSIASSQTTALASPSDGTIIQAEGDAQTKVQNDLLSIDLALEKEDIVLPKLHEDMQKEASSALDKAKQHPAVKVKTSGYSIYPVYERERIVRQHATYQISLETKDFAAGLSLATAMQPFQIRNLSFSVSPEQRKLTEKTLIEEAIVDLRDNVGIAANSLNAKTIHITNLTISNRQYNPIQPQLMKDVMTMESAAPVAAEAGESQVSITVSGSALAK